jgi:hypothetical protein
VYSFRPNLTAPPEKERVAGFLKFAIKSSVTSGLKKLIAGLTVGLSNQCSKEGAAGLFFPLIQ